MGLDGSGVAKLVGQESGAVRAPDAVSKSDLRHWCELIGDADPGYAEKIRRGEKSVPPAMLMAWTLDPLWPPKREAREPHEKLSKLLDEAGYPGALGVSLEQEFLRPVRLGDRLSFRVKVLELSPDEEQTGLGQGRLLRLLYTLLDQKGEEVSRQTYTVLRYRSLDPKVR